MHKEKFVTLTFIDIVFIKGEETRVWVIAYSWRYSSANLILSRVRMNWEMNVQQ